MVKRQEYDKKECRFTLLFPTGLNTWNKLVNMLVPPFVIALLLAVLGAC